MADQEFGGYDVALFLVQQAGRAGEELVFREPYAVLATETEKLLGWLQLAKGGRPYVIGRPLRTSPLAERFVSGPS